MNKVKLDLTDKDIETAMYRYLKAKYPNLKIEGMYLEYNRRLQYGHVTGTLTLDKHKE